MDGDRAVIADKTWCLNADKSRLVNEDDNDAHYLLVRKGCEIEDSLAARWGLMMVAESEKALASPPENKALAKPPESKRRGWPKGKPRKPPISQ